MHQNLTDTTSIYLQIANSVEDNILKDILLEDEQAPSTNELARFYSINPATAAKGLNLLVNQGILYKKRGLGMFVTKGAKQQILEKRKAMFGESHVKPMVHEAIKLGLKKSQVVDMLQKTFETLQGKGE